MAQTTFSGPLRAENGFEQITIDATGEATTNLDIDSSGNITTTGSLLFSGTSGILIAPALLADANANITAASHGGRISVVPALGDNRTLTLPTPAAGLAFKFIYGGAAEETENLIIDTGADANFFIGGITHITGTPASIYADGNSNSVLTLTDFGLMEINIVGRDDTNWYIWGSQQGADAPAFTDQ